MQTACVQDKEFQYQTHANVYHVKKTTTLGKVVAMLAAVRTHRLWVTNAQEKPIAVVTLSDVLRILTPPNIASAPGAASSAAGGGKAEKAIEGVHGGHLKFVPAV